MKTIKIVSKAFNIFCIVIRIISMIIISISWKNITLYPIFSLIMCFIEIIIATSTINSLDINKKSLAIGIVDLLFVSLVGGILYLCWDTKVDSQNNSDGNLNNNQQNYRNETLIPTQNSNQNYYDNLLLYNDINTSNVRYCRYCGHSMPANAMFCSYCGKNQNTNDTQNFGNNILQTTSNEITFRQQNNNNETTALTQNNNQNHYDKILPYNGANANNLKYCLHCGRKIPADASFCSYCGKNQNSNNN